MRNQTTIGSQVFLVMLIAVLLAGAVTAQGQTDINTGTTGVAWVFANGVMDWNTFQFKPLVQVTLHHLGQYDINGLMSVTTWPVSGTATYFRLVRE